MTLAGDRKLKKSCRARFEAADWEAMCPPHGQDINTMIEYVTDYINCLPQGSRDRVDFIFVILNINVQLYLMQTPFFWSYYVVGLHSCKVS